MGVAVCRKDGTRIGMWKYGEFIPNSAYTDEDKDLVKRGDDETRVRKRKRKRSDDVQETGDPGVS